MCCCCVLDDVFVHFRKVVRNPPPHVYSLPPPDLPPSQHGRGRRPRDEEVDGDASLAGASRQRVSTRAWGAIVGLCGVRPTGVEHSM